MSRSVNQSFKQSSTQLTIQSFIYSVSKAHNNTSLISQPLVLISIRTIGVLRQNIVHLKSYFFDQPLPRDQMLYPSFPTASNKTMCNKKTEVAELCVDVIDLMAIKLKTVLRLTGLVFPRWKYSFVQCRPTDQKIIPPIVRYKEGPTLINLTEIWNIHSKNKNN